MKKAKYILVLLLLFVKASAFSMTDKENPNEIVAALIQEIKIINLKYEALIDNKQCELDE